MLLGAVAGYAFGALSKYIINKIKLDFEGRYPVLVIALMFLTFSVTDFFGGNGFFGHLYLGNADLIHKKTILKMYDGLAWLVEIVLFLTLGLLVFPSEIIPYFGIGILISLFLILVARPIGVIFSLMFFKMKLRRRFYISWVGLRGAVPIVFTTDPLLAGIEKAHMIFNIVFFISVTSVLIQGTTLSIVAKWLHVALPQKAKRITEIDKLILELPKSLPKAFELLHDDHAVDKCIVDLHFPTTAFIVMIERDGEYIRPGGSTKLAAKDTLKVLAYSEEDFDKVRACLQGG